MAESRHFSKIVGSTCLSSEQNTHFSQTWNSEYSYRRARELTFYRENTYLFRLAADSSCAVGIKHLELRDLQHRCWTADDLYFRAWRDYNREKSQLLREVHRFVKRIDDLSKIVTPARLKPE
jgi:hypothetical protein